VPSIANLLLSTATIAVAVAITKVLGESVVVHVARNVVAPTSSAESTARIAATVNGDLPGGAITLRVTHGAKGLYATVEVALPLVDVPGAAAAAGTHTGGSRWIAGPGLPRRAAASRSAISAFVRVIVRFPFSSAHTCNSCDSGIPGVLRAWTRPIPCGN